MKNIFLLFIVTNLWAQPESWQLFNPANYEHQMSVTAAIFNNEVSEDAILGAFNEQEECVGFANSTTIPFGTYVGHEAFLIQIYSNAFSGGETISFKLYNQETETIILVENTIEFIQDSVFGNLVDPIIFFLNSNNTPFANNDSWGLNEDTMLTAALFAYDEDGDALTYALVSYPEDGTITLTDNMATYMPNINYNGSDSFQFLVNDGEEDSNTAIIMLSVFAVNDAPYLYSINDTEILFGETFVYELQAEDVDGDELIYTISILGGNATNNITGSNLTIIPQESNVTLNVLVTVTDGSATHSTGFLLTVLEEEGCTDYNNDGLVDEFPTITLNEGSVLLFSVEEDSEYTDPGANCFDNEDEDLTYSVEVSGQVVNMAIPNLYEIHYNCADSDGNSAQTATRTVVVVNIPIADENEDGFDDDAFIAGAQSGDTNQDGTLNVVDLVIYINTILNGE